METPRPPAAECDIGLATYLTKTPGIGGRLRFEAEDFRVVELGSDPTPSDDGRFTAARIRLRNWETNRFVGRAVSDLNLRRGAVAFAGMKDKRAVTEQWFSFQCGPDRLMALQNLDDVEVIAGPYKTNRAQYRGAHDGNRFMLRVREHNGELDQVDEVLAVIKKTGGVPNWFGPQRFGAGVRPVTADMGKAIVAGDLEEAVRLYVGNPFPGEHDDAQKARQLYEDTRDPEAALAIFPPRLDLECGILHRLVRKPGDWRYALQSMPGNLLQLFVHSHQSRLFNDVISARLAAGIAIDDVVVGDRVMGSMEDGTRTSIVTEDNIERVRVEIAKGRATATGPLVGMGTDMAEGQPGEIERAVIAKHAIDPDDFRCRELPEQASEGRRRGLLMPVTDPSWHVVDGDPVVEFSLGRGAYATIVMREVMKAPITAY